MKSPRRTQNENVESAPLLHRSHLQESLANLLALEGEPQWNSLAEKWMNPQAAGKMNRKMRFLWQWNEIPEIPHFQQKPTSASTSSLSSEEKTYERPSPMPGFLVCQILKILERKIRKILSSLSFRTLPNINNSCLYNSGAEPQTPSSPGLCQKRLVILDFGYRHFRKRPFYTHSCMYTYYSADTG